jgi:hypothetical protein
VGHRLNSHRTRHAPTTTTTSPPPPTLTLCSPSRAHTHRFPFIFFSPPTSQVEGAGYFGWLGCCRAMWPLRDQCWWLSLLCGLEKYGVAIVAILMLFIELVLLESILFTGGEQLLPCLCPPAGHRVGGQARTRPLGRGMGHIDSPFATSPQRTLHTTRGLWDNQGKMKGHEGTKLAAPFHSWRGRGQVPPQHGKEMAVGGWRPKLGERT